MRGKLKDRLNGPATRTLVASLTAVAAVVILAIGQHPSGVATASASTGEDPCPNAEIRAQQGVTHLSDCRAYEMVSPVDKNGGEVGGESLPNVWAPFAVAADGSAVVYGSRNQFSSPESSPIMQSYMSTRGQSGWTTWGISPPLTPASISNFEPRLQYLSSDFSKAVVTTNAELDDGAEDLNTRSGLYIQDRSTSPTTYTLLSDPEDPLGPPPFFPEAPFDFAAANPDLSHVAFNARDEQLLSGAPVGSDVLYEWAEGDLRLVGILPGGSTPSDVVIGARSAGGEALGHFFGRTAAFPGENPMSQDGSRIYFTVGSSNSGGELYVRQDGIVTHVVSASNSDPQDATDDAVFQFATVDGSKAFFTSPHQLTQDSSAEPGSRDLYRWDATASPGDRLTNLTADASDGGGVINETNYSASVIGSDDGSHVYFLATEVIAAGAQQGEPNLYLWTEDDEQVRFIAMLDWDDESAWGHIRTPSNSIDAYRDMRISDDGGRLLFLSQEQLTAHDNAGFSQAYLYDASTDDLVCVSCSSLAEPSTGDANLFELAPVGGSPFTPTAPLDLPRNLTADGSRVFFETDQRLVREDSNDRVDIYQWHEGELSLISDGESSHDARFLGASADGDDTFIITRARLSGWDRDHLADAYNAKVEGGFPEPAIPQPCVGEECQGPAVAPPTDLERGTASLRARADRPDQCGATVALARRHISLARQAMSRAARHSHRARRVIAREPSADQARRVVRQARLARRQARISIARAQRARQAAHECLRGGR